MCYFSCRFYSSVLEARSEVEGAVAEKIPVFSIALLSEYRANMHSDSCSADIGAVRRRGRGWRLALWLSGVVGCS